jgi:hypothetical protein
VTSWIVLLHEARGLHAYGPIDDEEVATKFADYLTREVDPAKCIRLRDPIDELLAYWRTVREKGAPPADWRPEYWPPQPGHIWQDRNGDRWIGAGAPRSGYLVCLARMGDDNCEEIWRVHGPMTFVQCISPTEEEVPF